MTKTNTEAVEAAYKQFLNRLEPGFAGCDMYFIFDAGYRSALSPTANTEPSAAGLEGWHKLPHLPKGDALYGAHDYLQDPEGLERFRSLAVEQSGHKMAPININSLRRLLDTISRLKQALSDPTRERELLSEAREWIKATHPADVSADALARRIDNLLNEGNADG